MKQAPSLSSALPPSFRQASYPALSFWWPTPLWPCMFWLPSIQQFPPRHFLWRYGSYLYLGSLLDHLLWRTRYQRSSRALCSLPPHPLSPCPSLRSAFSSVSHSCTRRPQRTLSCSSQRYPLGPPLWTYLPLRPGYIRLWQNLLRLFILLILFTSVLGLRTVLTADPNLPLATAAENISDLLRDAHQNIRSQYARCLAQNIPKTTNIDVLSVDRSQLFQPDSLLRCLLVTQGSILRDATSAHPLFTSFLLLCCLAINDEAQQGGQSGFTILAALLSRLCLQIVNKLALVLVGTFSKRNCSKD